MTATTGGGTATRAEVIAAAARRLGDAVRTGTPCAPVRDLLGRDDVDLAYAVQQALVAERVAAGAIVTGRKIGLTSPAVQRQLGVDRPDFGVLFADTAWPEADAGGAVDVTRFLQPRIEAEVAFVLGTDLDDADATSASVRDAVDQVVAALEIVDSRVAGWDVSLADTVADNASGGGYVLGARRVPLDEVEPAAVGMTMTVDGQVVSTGSGADCLGDPLAALAWLARTAAVLGDPLRAGDLVLSGALGPMSPVAPGARVRAEITGLGTVRTVFSSPGGTP